MKQKIWKRIINKKNSGKGFTLVELIIVLVILAILAALLLPTLTGYIDRANKMRVESACRMAVMGVKGEVSMLYGKAPAGADLTYYTDGKTDQEKIETFGPVILNIENLAEVDVDNSYTQAYFTPKAEVKKVIYKTAAYTCTYENDSFSVEKVSYDMVKAGIGLYYENATTPICESGSGEGEG